MTIQTTRAATPESAPAEFVQLLTPEGVRRPNPDHDVDSGEILGLYRDMVIVRRLDTEACALARQGDIGVWTPLLGQEAAQVGSARALRPTDMAFPTYREHGVAWCRGVDPIVPLGHFRGIHHAGWDPRAHHFHLYTVVVGGQTLHATGYAMGVQRDGSGDAVIAYFGDGAISQGDVNEAFGWAAAQAAPVVFFCQNNQWAISTPTAGQSPAPLYRRAAGFGFPGVQVDGNDVLACLAVTRSALDHAREGHGPTLIEAFTYRMGPHTTADDQGRYRTPEESAAWRARDPIERVRTYLLREGLADLPVLGAIDTEAEDIAADARARCRALPDPVPTTIFDHVYAAEHAPLAAQRAAFTARLADPEGSR